MATKARKAEQEDARTRLVEYLRQCGPNGTATLVVTWVGGRPTSTGRSDYYNVECYDTVDGRPTRTGWYNWLIALAGIYFLNKERDAVAVHGCGYSKPHAIVSELARLCGHKLWVQADSCDKWVEP